MNNLFNELSKNGNDNLISQFNQFRNTFQGNPREQVQALLNSGKMSPADFERLSAMATQLQSIIMR